MFSKTQLGEIIYVSVSYFMHIPIAIIIIKIILITVLKNIKSTQLFNYVSSREIFHNNYYYYYDDENSL